MKIVPPILQIRRKRLREGCEHSLGHTAIEPGLPASRSNDLRLPSPAKDAGSAEKDEVSYSLPLLRGSWAGSEEEGL